MYFLDNCQGLGDIVYLIKSILNIVFILIFIVLIVLIIIDIAKAVVAGDEKEVKAAQKAAIRRVVYAAVIFFVVTIVTVVFNLLSGATDTTLEDGKTNNWFDCWNDPKGEPTDTTSNNNGN